MSFAALTVACGDDDGGTPADAGGTASATFTVEHYDVTLDLTSRLATVTARLKITAGGDCVTMAFRPDAADAVTFDGEAARDVAVNVEGDSLTACRAGGALATDATVAFAVTATVPDETWMDSDVGFSTHTDSAGGTFTYLVSWVGGCSRHGICDASPDQFATYKFVVTHPTDTQVLCSGTITTESGKTTCDFPYAGGPTYSTFAIAARSPAWTEVDLGDWDGVKVTLYDIPGSMMTEEFNVAVISDAFAWLRETLGAYPYGDELRFFVGPTYWAGFEHPGNIALWEDLATAQSAYADGLINTVIHELAHQWAGDQATLASTYDFVWKEAMAEYLTQVYTEEQIGPAAGQKNSVAWKTWSQSSAFFLVPDEQPTLLAYYGDVYGPGPMILFRQLETMYSRAQVLEAIKALVGTGAPRTLSIDDVEDALADALGTSLAGYFDAWVHGTGAPPWPRATVALADAGEGDWTITVTTTTTDNKLRGCAFTVRVNLMDGTFVDVLVNNGVAGGPYPPVTITPKSPPTNTTLDPLKQCLVYAAPSSAVEPARTGADPWRGRGRK